ncbi:MAG: tetratricopeptide repeat protein [Chitinophagaceae bacterium]
MNKIFLTMVSVVCSVYSFGQKENKQIAAGNLAYQKGDFKSAARNYQQALKVNPKSNTAKYNLANALEKQKDAEQASKLYEDIAKNGNKGMQSDAYYNNGVTQVHNKDLKNAISSFENALRRNPNDQMARENLQKALNEKQQQDQQKQNQQNKQDNKQNQQQQKPQESPKEQQNKKDMDNLLKQLNQQEKDLQKKLQNQQQQRKQPEKDW